MTDTVSEQARWSPRRWAILVLAVAAAQFAFIFWLGERETIKPRPARPGPVLHVAESGSEWLALLDPTIFALPNVRGFAGLAWQKAPPVALPVFDWNEDPRWLALDPSRLGSSFGLLSGSEVPSWQAPSLPFPELGLPETSPPREPITRSSVRAEGIQPLAEFFGSVGLPSWPARVLGPTDTELLTNSVVQIAIQPDGAPLSVTLLKPGSGSVDADDFALAQARLAKFPSVQGYDPNASVIPLPDRLRWSRLVFDWHTVPATNVGAANP
jgi:hypothetical protein